MGRILESQETHIKSDLPYSGDPDTSVSDPRQAILEELERILQGKRFHNAGRAKQFLQFIVERKLNGHSDDLKERTIGTEVFQRSPDYSTGDDPVVRVQAGLVRRKLEQHYQDAKESSAVRIDLPLGSYAPEFQWHRVEPAEEVLPQGAPSEPLTTKASPSRKRFLRPSVLMTGLAISAVVILAVTITYVKFGQRAHQKSVLEEFWAPALAAQQPILLCVPDAVNYRPKQAMYDRYQRQHPGTFTTRTERSNKPLPLDPAEKLTWGDLDVITEWGITRGDLATTVKLAAFFGKLGKPMDLRVESEYSYRDLRDSPAVLVGAFNNEWTMNLVSDLRFTFVENGGIRIRQQWPTESLWPQLPDGSFDRQDYAIIARLNDSKTGQFTIVVAGLTSRGTEAAAEFVSSESDLEKFFSGAPEGWQSKSLELVLETEVTDGVSGPPRIIASNFW